ncbi:Gfo/Idh/MocA family oxidoreductase [Planktothrix sp. FACHB-1355]|uniref:Gfo/Idh/MocA family oxidoreductase n=1 Tax=Aerosakkonema funiforme FACHB-1375 TaxID=2949571 RepID=A0A926VI57_9CYAN|nr:MULTISPECIES: Gfo/Idh/MocA family oxidoreductase [Oscillatoriales]MBD2183074.1 Gfo/Idh/MocA family oxidoreductase [Aerosakkonema funiforme FACHB-1375]MBD3563222.1 Gfo/Idh/MocA family oxidoreductase [Planktothrix sp. FACHB-1355]
MTIKVAVLGAGRWGVHLVRNFLENPQALLVAVVDPNLDRLAALRSRYQLDESVVLATNWEQVRELPELEAVAIVTPASTHYNLIADALQQGYHVLAEKPLTLYPDECYELCRLAEQQQRQLVVDHTYLFHPAVIGGQAVMQKGTLGELRYGYAARTHLGPVRQDIDAMWDLAIHDIAIFNSWLGETPSQVQATGNVWLQNGLADLVWVTLTYPSGFQAYIHLCWSNPDKQRRLAVVGSQGTLIFDELLTESPLTVQHGTFEQKGNKFEPINQSREVVNLESGEPLKRVCEHFLSCVSQNAPSTVSSGLVGANLVQILRAMTESLEKGGVPISVTQLL